MRQNLESLVGREVEVRFTAEYRGVGDNGPVRCLKDLELLDSDKTVMQTLHHTWQQKVDIDLMLAPIGQRLTGIGVVSSYTKSGGIKDYTVQIKQVISS